MTQEEKAKRYDEALDRARYYQKENGSAVISAIFPELQENEDERIRKELIFYLGDMPEDTELRNGVTNRDVLVWLEKQGEQKQKTNYPKFDFDDILAIQCCMEAAKKVTEDKELYEKLKSLHSRLLDAYWIEKQSGKPQGKTALEAINEEKVDNQFCVKPAAWSKKDKKVLDELINFFVNMELPADHDFRIYASWLKSLKDRCTKRPIEDHYELEEFAKIVRGNLTGISKAVQKLFEAKYMQLTGNKMYGGFKD